jgi:hypothetical protein
MKKFKEEKRKELEKGYRQITTDVWGYRLIGKRFWVVLDFLWDFISQTIDEAMEKEREVNFDIDIRYEKNLLKAFNKFIEKWCGSNFAHLIDNDENDGEFMRQKIKRLLSTISKKKDRYEN